MAVHAVAFSPDNSRLASASLDRTIRIWDAATYEVLATLTGHADGVNGLAFSPDGARLASASHDGTIKFWDPIACEEVVTLYGHNHWVHSVAFSPDGRWLASGVGDHGGVGCEIRLWEAPPLEEIDID